MRVLITGGSGLLGSNLAKMASEEHEVYATFLQHPVRLQGCHLLALDITDKQRVVATIEQLKPDVIIHTAAQTNVDYCELHREEVEKLNVEATASLAEGSAALGCKLVYISSDYVFSGDKGMYGEEDTPNPINFYGYTKWAGEKAVTERCLDYLIARTSIYGWNIQNKSCFAEWVLDGLRQRREMAIAVDLFSTPILVNNLARALLDLVEKGVSGIYHVAGVERCSRFQFASTLAQVFGYDVTPLKPIRAQELKLRAKRPADVSLSVTRAQELLGVRLLGVADGLREMKSLLDSGYVRALRGGG